MRQELAHRLALQRAATTVHCSLLTVFALLHSRQPPSDSEHSEEHQGRHPRYQLNFFAQVKPNPGRISSPSPAILFLETGKLFRLRSSQLVAQFPGLMSLAAL